MINYDAIEGIDYIFNRFAYLGLSLDAAKTDIQKAIRDKRAEVHPDRLINVHEDILAQADSIRKLIDQCAEILLNDELRPLFIERLQEFQTHKPKLVSDNGTPIINMASEKLSLNFLLNEEELDIEVLQKEVQGLSGYNPKQLAATKRLYASDPEDKDNREMLEAALNAKLTYLIILEEAAWARAGVISFKPNSRNQILDPEEYLQAVEDEITARHGAITSHVIARNDAMRIGIAQAPLLIEDMRDSSGVGQGSRELSADVQKKITEKAQKVFSERAALIREIAAQKQQVLSELVDILVIKDLGVEIVKNAPYGIHLIEINEDQPDETKVLISFEVDPAGNITDYTSGETQGMTVGDLENMGKQGCIVIFNPQITEITLQVGQAARFYQGMKTSSGPVRPDENPQVDKVSSVVETLEP